MVVASAQKANEPTKIVVEMPSATAKEGIDESRIDWKLEQIRNEFRDSRAHDERVESFLAMIASAREQDQAKLREEQKAFNERRRSQDMRPAGWVEPAEPTYVSRSGEEFYQRMNYGFMPPVDRMREIEMERSFREKEAALREREAALRERERDLDHERREARYYYPQMPMMPPMLPQPYMQYPQYFPPMYQQPVQPIYQPPVQPVYQQPAQPTSRELELERELREKDRLLLEKESEKSRSLEHELAVERERTRNLMQSKPAVQTAPAPHAGSAPQQPVVVVPPVVSNTRQSTVYSPENPFSVNYRSDDK